MAIDKSNMYHNKWALVTGASAGIGKAYVTWLAQQGANIVLVARSHDAMQAIANTVATTYGVQTHVIAMDLSKPDAPQNLFEKISALHIHIDILINNAGFGVYGLLHETDLLKNQSQILLNVYALASLTQLFLPNMVQRKSGIIINVASIAGFQPLPYMAIYGATKAFVLSFTEALWAEYRQQGIQILAVCPGPVDTEFFIVAGSNNAAVSQKDTPENVVRETFAALAANQHYVIPGPVQNYVLVNLSRVMPRALVAKISAKMLAPPA